MENGKKFLEMEKYGDALREFERAWELNPRLSEAGVGIALASAGLMDYPAAEAALEQAERDSWLDGRASGVAVGRIRVLTMGRERISGDWLARAEDAFQRARRLDPDSDASWYAMGLAHKMAFDLSEAKRMFAAVIQKNGPHAQKADAQFALIQRMELAGAQTEAGRQALLSESLSRGQAAALLIRELDGTRFLSQGTIARLDPTDAAGHPYEAEILAVAAMGIHGLITYPDGTFRPDEPVTRGHFAQILEDALIRATGSRGLAHEFAGNSSPFPDVPKGSPWFNAVMVCATRGLMHTRDLAAGRFAPTDPVSGPDALLAVKALKRLINS